MLKTKIIKFEILFEEKKDKIKESKIISQQPKTIENPKIVDIKSVNIEYPKTLNKVFQSIRQAKKVYQISCPGKNFDSLYIAKQKKVKRLHEYLQG